MSCTVRPRCLVSLDTCSVRAVKSRAWAARRGPSPRVDSRGAGGVTAPAVTNPVTRDSGFGPSVLHAWDGLVHTVVHQPNMRIHVTSAILVGLVGSGIPLG